MYGSKRHRILKALLQQRYGDLSLISNDCSHADGRERLQGELMVSRAVGDLSYRKYGLIAEPEFAPWRSLNSGELNHTLCLAIPSETFNMYNNIHINLSDTARDIQLQRARQQ